MKRIMKSPMMHGVLFMLFVVAFLGAYRDDVIDWQEERVYIPASAFDTIISTNEVSAGVGGHLTEVGSRGIIGMTQTTADDCRLLRPFPNDIDRNYPVAFRVWYTSDGAGTADGQIDWVVRSVPATSTFAAAITDIAGTGMSATNGYEEMNPGAATDSSTVQYGLRNTQWDTLGTADLAYYNIDKGWLLYVECDADGGADPDELFFMGLEYAYVPKKTRGSGNRASTWYIPGLTYGGEGHGVLLNRK